MKKNARIIKEALSKPSVDAELLESPALAAEMRKQWDAKGLPDDEMLRVGHQARQSVMERISDLGALRSLRRWRRYGVAASIVLVAALGAGIGLGTRGQREIRTVTHVYHSGNRDRMTVTLDDGTIVELGARSRITFPERFGSDERRVEMEGQAYFCVARDEGRPFVVGTASLDVTALGTAFEVFESEGRTLSEVVLVEGKVRVDYPTSSGRESLTMNPDEKLTWHAGDKSVTVTFEDAGKYTAWKDEPIGLSFIRERLSNILPRLEKWFGCTIQCSSPEILDETFTFHVESESVEQIFDHMRQTLNIAYVYDSRHNTYSLSSKRRKH